VCRITLAEFPSTNNWSPKPQPSHNSPTALRNCESSALQRMHSSPYYTDQRSPFATENSCSYSNCGLEWIFHTVRVAFHRERITSPCSLTGYHHSNVLCTSDCISMHTYTHGRAGSTLECNRVQAINPDVHRFVLQHYNCYNVRLWPAHTLNACQKHA